jgi:hypothetical protein
MLTDLGDLSQAEAARRLGLSPPGMRLRVQRGRARLHDHRRAGPEPPSSAHSGSPAPSATPELRHASGGELTGGVAWSTIKVPIALRVLGEAGGPGGLDPTQTDLIERALTLSDNDAAATLFDGLAGRHGGVAGAARAVAAVLREAGDARTVVSTEGRDAFSPSGQTEWPLVAQHRFMAALAGGCIADRASRDYVLGLMGRVTSDQWGLGSAGAPARWKGGWGPSIDGGYLVRQMGVLEIGSSRVVVTLAVEPDDGTFASGQAIATELARWLVTRAQNIDGSGQPPDRDGMRERCYPAAPS